MLQEEIKDVSSKSRQSLHVQIDNETVSVTVISDSDTDTDTIPQKRHKKSIGKVTASPKTPPCTTIKSLPTPKTVVRMQSPKSNTPKLQSPGIKNSPQKIPGFRLLSIKEKAQAFVNRASSTSTNNSCIRTSGVSSVEVCEQVLDTPPKTPDELDGSTEKSQTKSMKRRSSCRLSTRLSLSQKRSSVYRHKVRSSIRLSLSKKKQLKQTPRKPQVWPVSNIEL